MRIPQTGLLLMALTLGACGGQREKADQPMADSAGEMGGMPMAMGGMQLMPQMRAHLDSLEALPPDQLALAMAAHQDLASRMMDAMGADMRGMNMQPDAGWTALGDSLRQDLADLPGLSGAPLSAGMRAHAGRMRRMLARHEEMMRM